MYINLGGWIIQGDGISKFAQMGVIDLPRDLLLTEVPSDNVR